MRWESGLSRLVAVQDLLFLQISDRWKYPEHNFDFRDNQRFSHANKPGII